MFFTLTNSNLKIYKEGVLGTQFLILEETGGDNVKLTMTNPAHSETHKTVLFFLFWQGAGGLGGKENQSYVFYSYFYFYSNYT